jgi:uncharacterized membrane protein YccF (DUF307 family)
MGIELLNKEALFVMGYISFIFVIFLSVVICCLKITKISINKFIQEYNNNDLDSTKND